MQTIARKYSYDNIGQLKTAQAYETDGVTKRQHEQFGYAYDAAWNLSQRTNNALVQSFGVNNLNELTTAMRSGTFTVAGTTTKAGGNVTSVTVSGTGLTSGSAAIYMDGMWARTNATLANGANSYTAVALDSSGRSDTATVSVNLPATSAFTYDLNGNLFLESVGKMGSGLRRRFCPCASLDRSLQPHAGMRGTVRLAHSQNPSPLPNSDFSDKLFDGTWYFVYDDENQLVCVTVSNAWQSQYVYDGLNRRRIAKDLSWSGSSFVETNEVRYVYDCNLEEGSNYSSDMNNLATRMMLPGTLANARIMRWS